MVHNSIRQNFRISKEPRTSNTHQFQKSLGHQTPPTNSKANGKVEAVVKSAKRVLRKTAKGGDDFYLGLLAERNIPSQGIGSSPVQGHMKRRWRTLLPTTGNLLELSNLNTSYEREAERCAKKASSLLQYHC